jgi:predicted MPP superfamily phosphohydrolase
MDEAVWQKLQQRLGRLHARQRLGIEAVHEARSARGGIDFFHVDSWYSIHSMVRNSLRVTGLYRHAQRNTARIVVRYNDVKSQQLPSHFDGFTILHISDMHVDMNTGAMLRLGELAAGLAYDLCVMTGDFRGKTYGAYQATLDGLARLRPHLNGPIYAVLGNHDTIQMVPGLEEMGIAVLLNECATIEREDQRIFLAGVDDPHFYRLDNLDKASATIPDGAFSILLSHTPEIYKQAAHAGFNLMLSGHTHGGQICLPGNIPIRTASKMPRYLAAGAWHYHGMDGYTSVGAGSSMVAVRLNCPPEITLHRLLVSG